MAFTGTPVITRVADNVVRLTGVSIDFDGSGAISQADYAGAPVVGRVPFPVGVPPWNAYDGVSLQDAVDVHINFVTDTAGFAPALTVTKTGVDPSDFLITIADDSGVEPGLSVELEIYIHFHT